MGRYKPKPSDLGDTAMKTLMTIRDGADVTTKPDATFLREIDSRFPGLIKIGPPMRNKLALFGVKATIKGHLLIDAYADAQKARVSPIDVTVEPAPPEMKDTPSHG